MNVLLGISGGIAAYKIPGLIRLLREQGCSVKTLLSVNGAQFVTPVTLAAVSENPVYMDTFAERDTMQHIALKDWADCMIIAPATGNILGKIAAGIGDDLLSTTAMAFRKRRAVCPAMNTDMWESPAVQRSISTLAEDGWGIIGPEAGSLACGTQGLGRMVDLPHIITWCMPAKHGTLVVTAGATRESIDPVRFISNPSTGKMGLAVARAGIGIFSRVIVIHGHLSVPLPSGVEAVFAPTADAMLEAVSNAAASADALVMAAAVGDFVPEETAESKIKKEAKNALTIHCRPAPDILKQTAKLRKEHGVLSVGFAMETEQLEEHAAKKLADKSLDAIVANSLRQAGAGFGTDTNAVVFITETTQESWPLDTKEAIGRRIIKWVDAALEA